MDNFKAVYLILSQLERDMDNNEVDVDAISHESLCVSENRWCKYIEMMNDCGYIKGAVIKEDIMGIKRYDISNMRITLKGLEYLQENSIMQRMYKTVKKVADLVP